MSLTYKQSIAAAEERNNKKEKAYIRGYGVTSHLNRFKLSSGRFSSNVCLQERVYKEEVSFPLMVILNVFFVSRKKITSIIYFFNVGLLKKSGIYAMLGQPINGSPY